MEKPKHIVFYSWQSDLDGKTTRSFIEEALKRAIKALQKDDTLDVEPVIDRDTKDVPGSPDIVKTILEKINRAQVFVGDVTIINQGEKGLTPNPNVIYELASARSAHSPRFVNLSRCCANAMSAWVGISCHFKETYSTTAMWRASLTCVPVEQCIEADYFLFLRDLLKPETKPKQMKWRAWITLPMEKPARYLYKAVRGGFAEQLARSLGVPDVPTLRSRLTERQNTLTIMWTSGSNAIWFDPLEQFDIDSIGSR